MKTTAFLVNHLFIASICFFVSIENINSQAAYFVQDGATIYVDSMTYLHVEGDVHLLTGSTFSNAGSLGLTHDFIQLQGSSYAILHDKSEIAFFGSQDQQILNFDPLTLNNLEIDNQHILNLTNDINVNGNVNLNNNGKIDLNSYNLRLLNPEKTILNYDENNYVIAEAGGVVQEVGSDFVTYPIGTSGSYSPLDIKNDGTIDEFGVYVDSDLRLDYPAGDVITDHSVGRVWHIAEVIPSGSDVSVKFTWNSSDELTDFNRDNCGIAHYENDTWNQPLNYIPATDEGNGYYSISRSGITSFSPFAIEDISEPLPVAYLSFTAEYIEKNNVLLEWNTIDEFNNLGFEIERKMHPGESFSKIGYEKASSISSPQKNYTFFDRNAPSGILYYRLKQIDRDGNFSYSEIIRLVPDRFLTDSELTYYPNPVKNMLQIEIPPELTSQKAEITLRDNTGKLHYRSTHEMDILQTRISVPMTQLLPGSYFLRVSLENGDNFSGKILKL